jgi:dTDP-4-dehydrorhamnose reductase
MKIWLTGRNGMLAYALMQKLPNGWECWATPRQEVDITCLKEVIDFAQSFKPEIIIHAAAYTDVGRAEMEPEVAMRVNALGAFHIGLAAQRIGAASMIISTNRPYDELQPLNPKNCYGLSKAAGEWLYRGILEKQQDWWIVRTSWLFGYGGKIHFIRKIMERFAQQEVVQVVDDQHGTLGFCDDIASAIYEIVNAKIPSGIYHVANTGVTTWYEVAHYVYQWGLAHNLNWKIRELVPVSTASFGGNVARPFYSALDTCKIQKFLGQKLPDWRTAIAEYLEHSQDWV